MPVAPVIFDFWPHDGGPPVLWREPCPFPADDADVVVYIEKEALNDLGYYCDGCGHLCGDPEKDLKIIRKTGAVACCPERKMIPLGDFAAKEFV